MLLERLRDRLQDRFPELHIFVYGEMVCICEPPDPNCLAMGVAFASLRGEDKFLVQIAGYDRSRRFCKGVERAYEWLCDAVEQYVDAEVLDMTDENGGIAGDPFWYHLERFATFAPHGERTEEEQAQLMASWQFLRERGMPADWIPSPVYEATRATNELEA